MAAEPVPAPDAGGPPVWASLAARTLRAWEDDGVLVGAAAWAKPPIYVSFASDDYHEGPTFTGLGPEIHGRARVDLMLDQQGDFEGGVVIFPSWFTFDAKIVNYKVIPWGAKAAGLDLHVRVGDRVEKGVAVGVAGQSRLTLEADPAQPQPAAVRSHRHGRDAPHQIEGPPDGQGRPGQVERDADGAARHADAEAGRS